MNIGRNSDSIKYLMYVIFNLHFKTWLYVEPHLIAFNTDKT